MKKLQPSYRVGLTLVSGMTFRGGYVDHDAEGITLVSLVDDKGITFVGHTFFPWSSIRSVNYDPNASLTV